MEFFPGLFIFGIIAVAILFRVAAGSIDHQRVREYVEGRGGKLLSCEWAPFGRGWFGEKSDRIYEVRYRDRDGNLHWATCKTSMWTGVYWTEDNISQYAERNAGPAAPEDDRQYVASLEDENRRLMALEEENRRLREEVERLKHRQF